MYNGGSGLLSPQGGCALVPSPHCEWELAAVFLAETNPQHTPLKIPESFICVGRSMLFKNPPLLEVGVAAQCLWVLLGHWYLPVWHRLGCWGSRGCLQMGPPQKQAWPGHTVGPHGEPHRGGGMHSAGSGMELAQPVLTDSQSPRGVAWGQFSTCPIREMAEHSVGLGGLRGAG